MGIGTKEDIVKAIAAGIDMFDCVMPTRIARHGAFFNADGKREQIKTAKFKEDFTPLDPNCTCYTCQNHSKAYLQHLWRANESVVGTLLSIHNLHYLINLTKKIRAEIVAGTFEPDDYLSDS
jgi:queuine tRNA-ribosyltransferase